jgi:branched-chain amino acid transport system substrate-binding protein
MRAVAAVALLGLAACKNEPKQPIVIGVIAPLTGPQASYGVSARNGIDLAVKEQSAKGGLLSREIRVLHLDSQGDPAIAADAARRLITEDKADLLLGEVSSEPALATAPVAQRALTPMLTPAATSPRVTELGDYVFRICFADPFQAEALARFAAEELALARVAVLRNLDSDYSIALAEAFVKRFTELGGTVVAREHFQDADESFEGALEKIRAAGAQAVYVPAYQTEIQELAKERKALGDNVVLLGGDGWDSNELMLVAGSALEGSYFTTHYSSDDPRPEVRAFVAAYHEEYNEIPDATAALGYDTARYAMAAIREADTIEKPEVREALAALGGFSGVTGPIRLDAKRNAIKPAVVLKIEAGKRKYVKSVAP